ncbi:MAG: hypothetical protein AAFX40_16405 [Cyanobacteria bacterium J06639_1]
MPSSLDDSGDGLMFPPRSQLNSKHLAAALAAIVAGSTWMGVAAAQTEPEGIVNRASATYGSTRPGSEVSASSTSDTTRIQFIEPTLTDPFGQVLNCDGGLLDDYTGYSVSLFDPDPADATGFEVSGAVPLTRTEVPNNPNNSIPGGIEPNIENVNPYFLTNATEGRFSFLFDANRGQTEPGRIYTLVVSPPSDEDAAIERRVRLTLGTPDENDRIPFTAQALDGQPLSTDDGQTSEVGFIAASDIEQTGLNLVSLRLTACLTETQGIRIDKSGDRASVAPGDTVIYRITVRSLSGSNTDNVVITDTLPLGFNLIEKSIAAEIDEREVEIATARNGANVTFQPPNGVLPANAVLTLIYSAEVTPNALRGSGQNSAVVDGNRDNITVKDGPVTHNVRLQEGIVRDAGTLIGRVFVDKNFDGEQQPGEPGVPDAVIFMEDGNRITTDPNGLFSVTNVLPGLHTGVLDLSSLPGYTLAPNLYFVERNSQSRLVNLAPGGMARMNFAVTPTYLEESIEPEETSAVEETLEEEVEP